jgi:parvulin-like peptidyl-prolyl isomerase
MKLTRRTNTIILWLISLGLVLGMIITFTPTMGGFGRGATADGSPPALTVNGATVSELQVARLRSNQLFNLVSEGEVGRDLQHLLVDEVVRQELVRQEAARQRVTDAEVRTAVDEFRRARGVAGSRNDSQYVQILANAGFTDESFRAYLREQLRQEKWETALLAGVSVSDEEVRAFYDANRSLYASEERIVARDIVLATREEAEAARLELVAGADPAAVASERSIERADRAGALGAPAGQTTPRPVGRPALPTAVANAAFALTAGGITEVVEASGAFHVVVVEEYLAPAPRPFEDVADQVRTDTLTAKQAAAIDDELARLRAAATVTIAPTSALEYDNVVMASVGEAAITRSDLVRATYTNPQIQQALSPDTAFIISAFFKPAILDQLIDQELAYQGARDLGMPFVGPRRFVAQTALNYVARDVAVSDADIARYYDENPSQFVVPASADVVQVTFDDTAAALAFRRAVLGGADPVTAASEGGGDYASLGRVTRGRLDPQLDAALFETNAFEPLGSGGLEISDVLVLSEDAVELPESLQDAGDEAADAAADAAAEAEEAAGEGAETVVVLIAERSSERRRPLEDVRAQIETTVLAEARAAARESWLADLRGRIDVVDFTSAASPTTSAPFVVPPLEEPAPAGDAPGEAPADPPAAPSN